jgi:predicted dehydrogenase
VGFAAPSTTAAIRGPQNFRPVDPVRVGYVGVGGRGTGHLRSLLKLEGVEIRAVCDIVEEKVANAQQIVVKAGRRKPEGYSRGETDFQRLCQQSDIDLVYTATPWRWHVPVCVSAMNAGKNAATEVPAAVTLEECWQLVETAEKTGKQCVMVENCCYDRTELMILNMVRKGLFGELLHAQCGYLHDLRGLKFANKGEGLWRRAHAEQHNGDLYPTHGLGPIAQCMDINRGNRFVRLVSMGSQSRGLNLFAAEKFGPDSPHAKKHYALSDVVSTLIQTATGQTILVTHNTHSPRPYSRDIFIQGTKGLVRKYPEQKICIEGKSKRDTWEPLESYRNDYEHPLWKELALQAKGAGHGGMDFIVNYRLIQALRTGMAPDMDVYDAATWSAAVDLSVKSIAGGNIPVDFPDFTRGAWKSRPPLGIVSA